MIRINFAGRLHRVYVGVDGLVHWGAYGGGSGAVAGYKGPTSDLGEAAAAAVAATGEPPVTIRGHLGVAAEGLTVAGGLAVCPEVYTDGNRLTFEARWSDGKVRQKVMSADDFRSIQEWQVIDTQPAEMAISGEPGPAVTDEHIVEVAVTEIKKRLES